MKLNTELGKRKKSLLHLWLPQMERNWSGYEISRFGTRNILGGVWGKGAELSLNFICSPLLG